MTSDKCAFGDGCPCAPQEAKCSGCKTNREMTDRQIAYHLLFVCIGDNCPCCDWADGDRSIMENMSLDTAQHIVDTVSEDEDFDAAMQDAMQDTREDSLTDAEADADTLASAGWGTDEDYGYYGDE